MKSERVMNQRAALLGALLLTACGPGAHVHNHVPSSREFHSVKVTIIGTNDLHGRMRNLPAFAGYVANLRRARAAEQGAVLLLDGGDMFQGTLESNMDEGAPIVDAYNAIGYTAAAIGNHEFDYGPVGTAITKDPSADPQGALKARASQAKFPFLNSNVTENGSNLAWPNVRPRMLFKIAGVRIGVVGGTTDETPRTTAAPNFAGLEMKPLIETIGEQASLLRKEGADVVVAVMHAGGTCKKFDDAADLGTCDSTSEVSKLANALPQGLVDVIVGGHTHHAIAHRLNGTAVIESWSGGRAFGRVDLIVNVDARRVTAQTIFPPRSICQNQKEDHDGSCSPGEYEGAPVVENAGVKEIVDRAISRASQKRDEPLGITALTTIARAYAAESPLGNLVVDMIRASTKGADVAVMNGGGLRANLPKGPLTYGHVYEVLPFDNQLVTLKLKARAVAAMVRRSLLGSHGIVSISGVMAKAECRGKKLWVTLERSSGGAIEDDTELTVVMSDFMAQDEGGVFGKHPAAEALQTDRPLQREAVVEALKRRGPTLQVDASIFDAAHRRLDAPSKRPVQCP